MGYFKMKDYFKVKEIPSDISGFFSECYSQRFESRLLKGSGI